MAKVSKLKQKINPLNRGFFGADQHKVPRFNADVDGKLSKDDLENPDLWVNVASGMVMGCEVRCIADDMSFIANGVCTFAQGSTAKIKIYNFVELDKVDYDAVTDEASKFITKLRGPRKWCVVNDETGEVIYEDIPTQLEAMRELTDYQKALRS